MADREEGAKKSTFWLFRLVRALYVAIRGYFAFVGLLVTALIVGWTFTMVRGLEKLPHAKSEKLPHGPLTLTLHLDSPIAQHSPGVSERFFNMLRGEEELYIPEIRSALRKASKDSNVEALEVKLGDVDGTPADFLEIRRVLSEFKSGGKTVRVILEEPNEWRYYLATVGDHITINPTSSVTLLGPSFQLIYFAEALKKVGVGIEVLRAGKYKSAFEPFVADHPSAETLEQYEAMRRSILPHIINEVADGRGKDSATVEQWYKSSIFTAKEALAQGMVDELGYVSLQDGMISDDESAGDEASDLAQTKGTPAAKTEASPAPKTNEETGQANDDSKEPAMALKNGSTPAGKKISLSRYQRSSSVQDQDVSSGDEGLALIEAVGEISMKSPEDGFRQSDGITPGRLRRELRWAAQEKDVKAVVLRVSSPGGSAVASDMIWADVKELAKTKPVVVSMGAYAASGGYYISAPATKIIAEPTTVTGSIGVIGMLPNLAPFKDKYGVSFHAVSGTERISLVNPGQVPTEKDREIIGRTIDDTYKTFVSKVAEGRNLEVSKVEALAQGRVYTGLEAQKLGLVDELGGLQLALNTAKQLGGLDPNKLYPLMQYEEEGFDLRHCLRRPLDCISIGTGTKLKLSPWSDLPMGDDAQKVTHRVVHWLKQSQKEGPLTLWTGYIGITLK